ncbi:MAG: Coenzyme F420 hydrogenase/dehydrogenase, beta subunit C-terminal domain [Crenarchaeota archaeon]|nr:Coenzyme F420 hydrogenase/dehydrogenase, beta subunit C-terminal domain [Thermoproteota archaeon]
MPLTNIVLLMKLLCVGCGACIAVCPASAILPTVDTGYFSIAIDGGKCVSCRLCLKVCPVINYLMGNTPSRLFSPYILKTYLAWALDERIRYRGASGGVVTALLKYLLEKKIVEGALVVRMRGVDPEAYIARSVDEILRAQGSIYFPTYSIKSIRQIMNAHGRYVIVGLPCQIDSINIMIKKNILKEDKIAFLFALRCHSVFARWYLDYMLHLLGLEKEEIIAISSRGFGWPGRIFILSKRGTFELPLIGGNLSVWNPLASTNLAAQLGCTICASHDGFGADIVFGDAWLPHIVKTDNKGTSLISILTEKGLNLVKEAARDGYIGIQEIPTEASQRPIPNRNVTEECLKTYIRQGIVGVLARHGIRGAALLSIYLLFYDQRTRNLILKLPFKTIAKIISWRRYFLSGIELGRAFTKQKV